MKRILFVDDEKNILDGVRRMLHTCRGKWEMEFVTSGEAALLACEVQPFDIVVSDLRMPGMDGAQLLAHLRDRYPSSARIILSGYSEIALTARAIPVAYRVLAKPCNAVDLKETIERVCTLQDVLGKAALRQVIGRLGELPSLSSTYMTLTRTLREPDPSITVVAGIIEQDMAMSAKVLQVVNSGFFGISQRATSVQHAVRYLGMETIKTLALFSEAFRVFVPDRRIPASFWQEVQAHSQRAAIVAGALPLAGQLRESTIIAALLHDIGKLVLASAMPDQFCAVLSEMEAHRTSEVDAEEALFGTSHAEIGAYLLGLWGIDTVVVEAIAHHHHPARVVHTELDCLGALYLVNLLAHEIERHPEDMSGEQLDTNDRETLQALGLLNQFAHFRECAESVSLAFPG